MTAGRTRVCTFPDCGREVWALGLCAAHYRQQAAGRPLAPIKAFRPRAAPAQIVALWDEGLSQAAIRDRTGATEKRIKKVLQDAGRVWEPRRAVPQQAEHGQPGRWAAGCRCEVCVEGKRAYKAAEYRRRKETAQHLLEVLPHPSPKTVTAGCRCEKCARVMADQIAARQARTKEHAEAHGEQWTPEEVFTAARDDLPLEDIAKLLGRTYAAVSNVRAALADPDDPAHDRYAWLLHVAEEKRP